MSGRAVAKRAPFALLFALICTICIASPGLADEREASEFAYTDLSPAEEEQLLQDRFGQQLQAIDSDPARALEDLTLHRIDSPTEAVAIVDGEKVLLESEVPLRAPEEDGDLHKVELGLEETAAGYAPANPLVDLSLPDSADEPIEVGEEGLTLTPVGTTDAPAEPLGGEDLFLPGAQEDTSLLLSPIAGGVELSALLVSRNSPEQLAFDVGLPQGASLHPTSDGGAEVVDATGGQIARVTSPHAVDAEGTEIPVSLQAEGGSLVLSVPHREMDVAYPLFVDPSIIEENWTGFTDASKLNYWTWSWSGVGSEDYIGKREPIVTTWGPGLYVRSRSNFSYPKGSWGRWWFAPQGSTTFMRRVIVGPMNYDAHGCTANEPHPYVGVWNDSSGWKVLSNAYPSGWGNYIDTGPTQNLGAGTRTAFVGIEAANGANISCGHDYRLGGATLFLDDPENPTAGAASGYPTGWVKAGSTFTINAPVSDPGLGAYSATLSPGGSPPVEKKLSCDGHYSNKCPASNTFQFPIGVESFDEGEKPVRFSGRDAIEKPSNTVEWMMKVDRTAPEIGVSGQFAEATDETEGDLKDDRDRALIFPTYSLTVDATDGRVGTVANPVQPAEKRSGVKKIEVFVDQGSTPVQTWEATSCTAGNCPLSKTFTVKLNELSPDTDHYLRILARDFAGNAPSERKLEFEYIPATGMKDEYVQQYFPLPDGSGNEAEEEHPQRPELVVNLLSGNLVYRQQDAEVEGPGADLGVELFYNSLLPSSQDTEFGDGWTMAQAPELEIEEPGAPGPPSEATLVEESGSVESKIDLPSSAGEESFDKTLQATVTKEAGGGYEVADESGETDSAYVFDAAGQVEEARTGTAATVDYESEGGNLSEIAVEDPATADVDPATIDEGEVFPDPAITHSANFGSNGTADGQFKTPADAATDSQGNLWVLDRGNGRIQKFGLDGQFISKFGSPGSAEGKLETPGAITLDAAGNILVAEYGRVQKFSPSGQLLAKFGPWASGQGAVNLTNGITPGIDGSIWVSDLGTVQRYTASGQFIERVGASGTGAVVGPQSLDTAPNGDVYVADAEADRIKVFNKEGDFVRQFGSAGSGPGQFLTATEVDVDADGNVWVADSQADRVQLFNGAGDFIAQFGSAGSGAQQFQFTNLTGLTTDGQGRVWVADPENSRVSEWVGGNFQPAAEPTVTEDDPQLDVNVSAGLVSSVEGEEVGTITYAHTGALLTSVTAPDGKASFAYDSAGRMTKVTQPNGTYGEVAYEATYGRVKSVTVAVEGKNPKTTYFAYSDEPRRTTVTPPDAPATTYDIAANGSILKWWNTKAPPVFTDLAGTLYDPNNRETSQPIATGVHNLLVQAHDDEGLASIQIVANNDQLVDEKTCEYPSEPSKCASMANEWVTETGNWPPGILYLEAIATDRLGEATSQRFWVNIPYTPPPDPEAEEPPRFNEILSFREEFGLDLDLKGNETAINDRVFDLMGAWHNPNTPDGEVARATAAKWGVPLRSVDAAELEDREEDLARNGPLIQSWGESRAPATYAGYYMDHAAGGKIRVGFTSGQNTQLETLKAAPGVDSDDRITAFSYTPTRSLQQLQAASSNFNSAIGSRPDIQNLLATKTLDVKGNTNSIGATNAASVEAFIAGTLGSNAGFAVHFASKPVLHEALVEGVRMRELNHRLYAGDWAVQGKENGGCTLAFGAWEFLGYQPNGSPRFANYALTAGHCFAIGAQINRRGFKHQEGELVEGVTGIGKVVRRSFTTTNAGFTTDAEAIRLGDGVELPRWVYWSSGAQMKTNGAGEWIPGMTLCHSGTWGGSHCGPTAPQLIESYYEGAAGPVWQIRVFDFSEGGDSGSPVWDPTTNKAVGLLSGGPFFDSGPTDITPLLPLEGKAYAPEVAAGTAPGALAAPGMTLPRQLHIVGGE